MLAKSVFTSVMTFCHTAKSSGVGERPSVQPPAMGGSVGGGSEGS
eukprot:CAMPEP_0114668454 /NCGR_PEP_ID=MMETSP0191-20121206/36291_1 /TAXON_ID=126664 /ORGANISM="Sorites sp." /LENGTH=44 /DNA_ID= /DNA_START= /DNA_END= /DNA_ORIENTATION=